MGTYQSSYTGIQIDTLLDYINQGVKTTSSPTFVATTLSGLPVFADESSASSLATGVVYQTAGGELRIKL